MFSVVDLFIKFCSTAINIAYIFIPRINLVWDKFALMNTNMSRFDILTDQSFITLETLEWSWKAKPVSAVTPMETSDVYFDV
jgi:hypothetical protein